MHYERYARGDTSHGVTTVTLLLWCDIFGIQIRVTLFDMREAERTMGIENDWSNSSQFELKAKLETRQKPQKISTVQPNFTFHNAYLAGGRLPRAMHNQNA